MLRIRSTYLYLAVALGLFCYIYFIDFKYKSTDEASRTAGNLYDFRADQITRLEITNSNGTTVLEKHDDRWKITKPVQAFPEAGVVQQILGELEFARSERIIRYSTLSGVKEETIKQWNLNPPVVRVTFSSPKESHVLLIGRNVALTETVYARASTKPDAPIYIIRSTSKAIIDRSLADLRSRAVFDFDSTAIDRASVREFTSGAQVARDVEITRTKENQWSLQKPLVARAEKARVDAWLKQVQDLRVIDFVSDESSNLSSYGLSSPTAQITVQRKGEAEELSLVIGTSPQDKPQEVYAKRVRSNSVFTLSKEAVAKLMAGLPESRDKKLVSIAPADVVGVAIEQKGKVLSVQKREGVWMFEGESDMRAEAGKVQDFVNRMLLLQSTQFVKDAATDLRPYGLDKPQTKVTVRYLKDKETVSVDLLFGKVDAKQIFATTSTEPFIYSVPSGALDSIPKDALLWRDAQVLRLAPEKVKEVTFTGKEGASTTLKRESKDAYTTTTEGYAVDAIRAEAQVSIVCNLRAVQWLGKPLPIFQLDKPAMQVVLTTAEGKTVLRVGAPLMSGGRAAQVEGQASSFEMSLADFAALEQSVLTKAPVKAVIPPTDAEKK